MDPDYRSVEELQQEVQEIAEVLLRSHPPGTEMIDVWQEALSLHRVRYDSQVLPRQEKRTSHADKNPGEG